MKPKHIYLLIGILAVAAFFRLYLIGQMPGGLFPDEAANGLDINLMEQGHLQPFYERGNGREALFFYMEWVGVKIFGRTPLAHHITSAVAGIAATALCFVVAWWLFEDKSKKVLVSLTKTNPKVFTQALSPDETEPATETRFFSGSPVMLGLLASFLMAASVWHTVLSRTAFRANLIPLFTTLTFICMLGSYRAESTKSRIWWATLFGASLAGGFYTYIAFRIMGAILVPLFLWPVLVDTFSKPRFESIKKFITPFILSILAFALVIAPIGYYFYTHPGSFIGRSGQVSVFNPELNQGHLLSAVTEVTKQSLLGFFTQGDLNWRHNLSGYPFLSPIVSPFFALGLLLTLLLAIRYLCMPRKHASDYPYFLLAGWFFGMLLPVITTAEGIPHGLRSIGMIPAVFIISALGMYTAWQALWTIVARIHTNYPRGLRSVQLSLYILAIAILLALPIQTYALYFIGAYNDPANFYSFRSDLTVVSDYLNHYGNRNATYLILDKFSIQTVDYLTTKIGQTSCDRDPAYRPKTCVDDPTNKPYVQIDPEDSWRPDSYIKDGQLMWTNGLKPGDQIIFAQSSIFDIKKFKQFHPEAHLIQEQRNKFGQAVLAVYKIK